MAARKKKAPGLLARLFGTRETVIHLRPMPKARAPKAPRPRTPPRPVGPATAKMRRKPIPSIATRRPGPMTPAEIVAELKRAGTAVKTVRRNPAARPRSELALAREQARQFQGGAGRGHVVQLDAAERRGGRSRYAVLIGTQTAVEYRPPLDSKRAGATWRHVAGDRGPGAAPSSARTLLVADPRTREVFTVAQRGRQRFDPKRGIVG